MSRTLLALAIRLHGSDDGQGLVEYLLILAMVALATIAGMSQAANSVTSAFIQVGAKLGQYIS